MAKRDLTNLTKTEYGEILGLEYVLTWNYTCELERDENRYLELSSKLWGE